MTIEMCPLFWTKLSIKPVAAVLSPIAVEVPPIAVIRLPCAPDASN